ncbi:MAG TPA: entericidin A/B family lipoprotein [Nitrospirae bacterium]|nr:entericidin A/B family lipoprotein [Nitrospirota bacterium]
MYRILSLIVIMIVLSSMGCNTVHGVGKDIESAGKAIQKSSK